MTLSIIFHFLILGLYQLHSSQVRTWLIFSRSIITLVSDSCNPTFEYIFKLFLNQYSTCHYVRSPQFHNHPNGQPVLIIVLLTGWTISFPTYDLLSHSCFFAGSLNLSLPILYNSTQALPFSLLSYFYPLLVRLGCPVFLFSWNFSISLPQQCPSWSLSPMRSCSVFEYPVPPASFLKMQIIAWSTNDLKAQEWMCYWFVTCAFTGLGQLWRSLPWPLSWLSCLPWLWV